MSRTENKESISKQKSGKLDEMWGNLTVLKKGTRKQELFCYLNFNMILQKMFEPPRTQTA